MPMRRTVVLMLLAAVALAFPVSSPAQPQPQNANALNRSTTLAYLWDLDGEAADDDQIVAGPDALADSTTYTLDAQPDTCRLVDITVTDADSSISAGVLTVAGTSCTDTVKSCTFTFAAGGTGVKSLTCTDGQGAYLKTVTSVTTGALTGEGGGDTLVVGYTTSPGYTWAMYGKRNPPGPNGEYTIDPWSANLVLLPITTSSVLTTTVTSVASNAAFTNVVVGDLLYIQVNNQLYERKVTARASADSITVDLPIMIPIGGVTFSYKNLFTSTNPADGLWMQIGFDEQLMFRTNVLANANTGGVVQLLECTVRGAGWPASNWMTLSTDTTTSGSTAMYDDTVDLDQLLYSHCRLGFKFGTADDADVAPESITVQAILRKVQ